jgi:hypothetical protein
MTFSFSRGREGQLNTYLAVINGNPFSESFFSSFDRWVGTAVY